MRILFEPVSQSWTEARARTVVRRSLASLLALAAVVLTGWGGFRLSERQGTDALRAESNHKLDLFASAVEGVVRRLEHVPATIQLDQDVLALLRQPRDARRVQTTNTYLRRLNAHLGSRSVFVLNERGVVVASSHPDPADDSQLGADLSFRPYFLEALSGRVGRHFAMGLGPGEPGYFVSHPIRDGARVVGVAAIKIGLEPIEQTWDMLGSPALLADANQVVILSSEPEWRYTTLADQPVDKRVDMQLSRLYGDRRLGRFPLTVQLQVDQDSQVVDGVLPGGLRTPLMARHTSASGTLVLGRTLDGMDWRLLIFVDLRHVRNQAVVHSMLAMVAAGFVLLLGLFVSQRRRIVRQKLEAKQLLERANATLEQKVARRTSALTEANTRLRKEVAERQQAEATLRAAQDELIHAGKMAVLGQLATGITHELTQPLGAIRTLSGNALEFMRRGHADTALGNLEIIARLSDQMGQIIQPLKGFARKSQAVPQATDVAHALGNALFLFDQRLRKQGVQVVNEVRPGQAVAWCDSNRLEQVLINLVGNALDAMQDSPGPQQLLLRARHETPEPPHSEAAPAAAGAAPHAAGWLRLDVCDSGPGLSPTALERLFEPFFTTKEAGVGLGLGLAISRDIAREFHGELDATNRPEGGACFRLRLPAAPTPPSSAPKARP